MGASAGRVLLIPKGDWNANTTYTGLDWVRHNGAAWVCKNTCTNIEPTLENADNWQMIARDGDMVTADTAMSDSSTNAVQNKVIKSYVDDKFSFSDHDTATSGTSFADAEDGNMLVTDWTKNLLNPTLGTTTMNGVTCTANGDGTYTLNGTPTGEQYFKVSNVDLVAGKNYKLVGCPTGGDYNGFSIYTTTQSGVKFDIGYTSLFKAEESKSHEIIIRNVDTEKVFSNLLFKPMIVDADLYPSATYDDFVPYGGYEIQSCGKNLFDVSKRTNGKWLSPTDGSLIDGDYYSVSDFIPIKRGVHYVSSSDGQIGHDYDESYYCIYDSDKNFVQSIKLNDHINFDSNINGYLRTMLNNGALDKNIQIEEGSTATEYEPYTGETITVTNTTESPAFGLKSHKGITNIISPGNVKCVQPTNESGKGVLDAMYNNSQLSNELSKLKNAIIAMGGTV